MEAQTQRAPSEDGARSIDAPRLAVRLRHARYARAANRALRAGS
jgi:hypothetical protein